MAGLVSTAPRAVKHFLERHASFVGSVTGVRTTRRQVVLSYDDGPEPGGTDKVLGALAAHGATATFFVLLTRARRHPGLLADVVAAGHEIALHGLDHRRLTAFSFAEVRRRTADGRAELEDIIGRRVDWVRPPYGRQTLRTWRAVKATGLQPVMWGPSAWDSQDVPQAERVAKALQGVAGGSILLAHDGYAGPLDGVDDGPAPVLDRGELTARVLDEYQSLGLTGCSLGDALTNGDTVRTAWFQR